MDTSMEPLQIPGPSATEEAVPVNSVRAAFLKATQYVESKNLDGSENTRDKRRAAAPRSVNEPRFSDQEALTYERKDNGNHVPIQ